MGARAAKQQVKIDHFLFGKVTLKNQFNKQLITFNKPLVRTDQTTQWQNKYKIAASMNKQSLLLPENYDPIKVPKFFMCCECPADMEIDLTYEKFQYTLEKQINNRKANNKYFTETDIFFIWFKLLQGCKEFQLNNMQIGDIRPSKIVKMKKGDLKLINVASFPNQNTPIQRILDQLDNKTVFYLAPEEIQYLKSRGYGSGIFPNAKTQAFSLGLTILQCATLTSSQDFYSINKGKRELNKDQIQFRLLKLQERYKNLVKYLKYVLQWDQSKRLSSGQIWARLKPYSSSISKLEYFSSKQTDQKISLNQFLNQLKRVKR